MWQVILKRSKNLKRVIYTFSDVAGCVGENHIFWHFLETPNARKYTSKQYCVVFRLPNAKKEEVRSSEHKRVLKVEVEGFR